MHFNSVGNRPKTEGLRSTPKNGTRSIHVYTPRHYNEFLFTSEQTLRIPLNFLCSCSALASSLSDMVSKSAQHSDINSVIQQENYNWEILKSTRKNLNFFWFYIFVHLKSLRLSTLLLIKTDLLWSEICLWMLFLVVGIFNENPIWILLHQPSVLRY